MNAKARRPSKFLEDVHDEATVLRSGGHRNEFTFSCGECHRWLRATPCHNQRAATVAAASSCRLPAWAICPVGVGKDVDVSRVLVADL
eukprot:9432487-Heterocapsa_arctica.AAC.1